MEDSIAIDSLVHIIDSLKTVVFEATELSNSNSINIKRTLFSSIIIILLFLLERIFTYLSTKKLRKAAFYQEVVIKPHIDCIISFFNEFYDQLTISIQTIRVSSGTGDEIDNLKKERLNILKLKKINFDHEFLSLIRSVYPKKANSLSELMNEIEDIATKKLTNQSLSDINLADLEKEIHKKKAEFFQRLN